MEETIDKQVITLALEDITRETGLQVRNELDNATINMYMSSYKNGAKMPPVEVARIGEAICARGRLAQDSSPSEAWRRSGKGLNSWDNKGRSSVEGSNGKFAPWSTFEGRGIQECLQDVH